MDKAMRTRLESIKERDAEITEAIMQPETLSDMKLFAKLGREQASLQQTLVAYNDYLEAENFCEQAKEMLELNDPDLTEMAQLEIGEYTEKMKELEALLQVYLIPKDPNDAKDCILEIRGAAGGDEGNIFAGDLYRMYTRYAENLGYKFEVIEASESEAGGYNMISFAIKGADAYRHFKFESGAHRVQRIPRTETQGRVHTSTATVLAMADVEDEAIEIDENDLEIDTMRSSGAGGQHVNKTDSAVRITHIPTGISVKCQDGRSQHDNRDKAMRLIRARVYAEYQRLIQEEKNAKRQSKMGGGDRSEKIRTYNYPQNRVSDHRIGLTLQKLDIIMEGKLDEFVEALLAEEQKEILEHGL